MGQIIEVLLAIPRIMGFVKDIIGLIQRNRKERKEREHLDAMAKLRDAQTEEEIKDATRERAKHP